MQTVDDLPGCAFKQHLVGTLLRALTNRTSKFKLYIHTYLRRFQLLEPSLDLCRDDTRKTARRIGPRGRNSPSVREPPGRKFK